MEQMCIEKLLFGVCKVFLSVAVNLEDQAQCSREIGFRLPVGVIHAWECPKVLHFLKIHKVESTGKLGNPFTSRTISDNDLTQESYPAIILIQPQQ